MKLNLDYIGGFFDGEGCVSISPTKGPRVILTNTNLALLRDIQEFFGGKGKIRQKKRTERDAHTKPCWQWACWSASADEVLRILLPHLVLKRVEAELALRYRELTVTPGRNGRLPPLSEAALSLRAEIAVQARALKCA